MEKTTNIENEWQTLHSRRFDTTCSPERITRQLTLPEASIENASVELFRSILTDQILAQKNTATRKAVSEVARWADRIEARIRQRVRRVHFRRFARQWKRETSHMSSIEQRSINLNYQRVIGMGPEAVPLILEELKRRPDDWFWALHAITGEDPVPAESRGRMTEMVNAWLEWGRKQNYEV